jgi:hypothetical protein
MIARPESPRSISPTSPVLWRAYISHLKDPYIMLLLEFDQSETVGDIKVETQLKLGMRTVDFFLTFRGQVLQDDCVVSSLFYIDLPYIIIDLVLNKTFNLVVFPISSDEGFLMKVSSSSTIADLKTMIHDEHGIPEHQQVLTFEGSTMDNDKTLFDYDIQKDDFVFLKRTETFTLQVRRHRTGLLIEFLVEPDDTISDVKAKVRSKTGIRPEHQMLCLEAQLSCPGRILCDHKTLRQYDVGQGASLWLV